MKCTPKARQTSNFWGVIILNLTYEDKVKNYKNKNLATHNFLEDKEIHKSKPLTLTIALRSRF